jgi:hypothetical protein
MPEPNKKECEHNFRKTSMLSPVGSFVEICDKCGWMYWESQEPTSEEWVKEFDRIYDMIGQDVRDYQKVFIRALLEKEREITKNSILMSKKGWIEQGRQQERQRLIKWVNKYDDCDYVADKIYKEDIIAHLKSK